MVQVVMVGAGPEWEEMMEAPRELVAAMRVDCLEQAQHNPDIHREDMQISSHSAPKNRAADSPKAQDHHLNRGGIFGSHAEGSRILVVDLVNGLVQGTPVEGTVRPVMPGVFQDEEDGNLVGHFPHGRERNRSRNSEELSHGMEQPKEHED